MKHQSIVIIGAGPAGLAIAGCLSHQGIDDYIIIESADEVGSSWRNHYDRLHLHTVKKWSHLPHLPFPQEYPVYVSREQVVDYLSSYAKHFAIKPRLSEEVKSVTRSDSGWNISTSKETFTADHVVVATGVNKVPKMPIWPGQDDYKGKITHSKYYKNPEPYLNQSVLVVGMGNTGAEVALDLANHDVDVHISVRSPISLVPRDLNGRPVQETAKILAKIPFGLGDWLGSQIRKVYFGNVEKYGLRISKMHPTVQLRETGKTPVIDLGTVDLIKKGKIKVHPDIKSFDTSGAVTIEGKSIPIDQVILSTGYTAAVESFMPSVQEILDKSDIPGTPIGEGNLSNAYFLGFDNYKVGGILGSIHTDSQLIAQEIIKKIRH